MGGTVLGVALVGVGCSSGSHRDAASPAPTAAPATTPASPVLDPRDQAIDELAGSARITFSTAGDQITVKTTAGEPVQLGVDAQGHAHVQLTMHDAAGDLFALSGLAAVGRQSGDEVSVLSPSTGLLVDTTNGNACTVSYTRVSETALAGTARCDAETGAQRFTVTVEFTTA